MFRFLITFFLINIAGNAYSQGPDAELVKQKTDILVKAGRIYKTHEFEIRINNRQGEKYTDVAIPFSKLNKVSKIDAWIKDKSGTIIKRVQKSDITDRSAISDFSFYEDDFIKEFTLKHSIYPYSIFYTFQEQQDEFIFIDHWIPVIDPEVPTLKAVLNVEIPKGYHISYSERLTDSFKADSTGQTIRYSWTSSYTKLIDPEKFSPPESEFLPRVIIVPHDFRFYTEGSFKSWTTFGDWLNELLTGLSDLPAEERNVITGLIRGVDNKKEKIRKLYHYLQDRTRYINITIETGGLRPYPASYVSQNRYGDCKALTNYFKAVLESAGIESFYTIVEAGEPVTPVDKSLPSQQFNHVILCVPLEKDTVWLDCTTDGPFGYLGTFTQNREVFIVKKNSSHFTRTKLLTPAEVLETRSVKFVPDMKSGAMATFRNTYKGEKGEMLNYLLRFMSEPERTQIIRSEFTEKGFQPSSLAPEVPHRDSARVIFSYNAVSAKVYNKYGDEIIVYSLPFSIPQFEDPAKRKTALQLDYPVYKADTLVYELPSGWIVSNRLANQTLSEEFGAYKLSFEQKDNNVRIVKSVLILAGKYPVSRYKEFYDFIHKIREIESTTGIVATKQK